MWEDVRDLVNEWHRVADGLEGYDSRVEGGKGIHLLLLYSQTPEGDVKVTCMAARDYLSLFPLSGPAVPANSIIPESTLIVEDGG